MFKCRNKKNNYLEPTGKVWFNGVLFGVLLQAVLSNKLDNLFMLRYTMAAFCHMTSFDWFQVIDLKRMLESSAEWNQWLLDLRVLVCRRHFIRMSIFYHK